MDSFQYTTALLATLRQASLVAQESQRDGQSPYRRRSALMVHRLADRISAAKYTHENIEGFGRSRLPNPTIMPTDSRSRVIPDHGCDGG